MHLLFSSPLWVQFWLPSKLEWNRLPSPETLSPTSHKNQAPEPTKHLYQTLPKVTGNMIFFQRTLYKSSPISTVLFD